MTKKNDFHDFCSVIESMISVSLVAAEMVRLTAERKIASKSSVAFRVESETSFDCQQQYARIQRPAVFVCAKLWEPIFLVACATLGGRCDSCGVVRKARP